MFYIALTVLLALLPITIHEIGHTWAMRRCGVPIREISLLGFKVPFLPSLTWNHQFSGQKTPTKVSIHPFLLGAYVMPDEKAMEALSAKDKAFVAGAGPWVNFIWTAVTFGFLGVTLDTSIFAPVAIPLLGIAMFLIITPKFSSRYIVLGIGCLLLASFLYTIVVSPNNAASGMGGPVTIVDTMSGFYKSGASAGNEFRQAVMISGFVSILLGTTNALPLFPLDGGHIMKAYLGLWSQKVATNFAVISGLCFTLLIGIALTNDMRLLF